MIQYASRSWAEGDRALRRDIRLMGWMLRHVVTEEYDPSVWQEVRQLREWAGRHESGDASADREMSLFVQALPLQRLDILLRILGIFFDLANVSEDLQRERVLRERREQNRLSDSLSRCLDRLKESSLDPPARQALLDSLEAEFVFTAHPTEARRQTVRHVLRRLRADLIRLEEISMQRSVRRRVLDRIREDMRMMLRTDPLHPHRPRVLDELNRALVVSESLWQAVPSLVTDLEEMDGYRGRPLRFGCWIGGDRDGHPHVTVDVTRETLSRLRDRVLTLHLKEVKELMEQLTGICRSPSAARRLEAIRDRAAGSDLDQCLHRRHPHERYRHALEAIRLRLRATVDTSIDAPAYPSAKDLEQDVVELEKALREDGFQNRLPRRVHRWSAQIRVFGLHLMRLDIRENSEGFRCLVRELLPVIGERAQRETENRLDGLWQVSSAFPGWNTLREQLSERSWDLLAVLDLMQGEVETRSDEGVGAVVISMTHSAEDVLWVLWLNRLLAQWRGADESTLPIAPLFETIDDLAGASDILEQLFDDPQYNRHLNARQREQMVMIGYSDSAKDGGYLAACWALYRGQESMQKLATQRSIQLTCFHGRGGALGRGGGPAARAIQALPPQTDCGRIRMTEQGEVIADRFVDPILAHRHMEQILGGLILHAAVPPPAPSPEWLACMEHLSSAGRDTYLALLGQPGFLAYFRQATPISSIEGLPIGSRPSRRHGAATLQDLRAIPYTFAWTQSRQLINAFYGLGSAWESLRLEERKRTAAMYRDWPFFRSMIDNAELALSKCDPVLARAYAELVEDRESGRALGDAIVSEMEKTRRALLELTERDELLQGTVWLRRSVDVRKPYIDVLNYIQIELMKRERAGAEEAEPLQRSLRLSVQAVAAGLRTTG